MLQRQIGLALVVGICFLNGLSGAIQRLPSDATVSDDGEVEPPQLRRSGAVLPPGVGAQDQRETLWLRPLVRATHSFLKTYTLGDRLKGVIPSDSDFPAWARVMINIHLELMTTIMNQVQQLPIDLQQREDVGTAAMLLAQAASNFFDAFRLHMVEIFNDADKEAFRNFHHCVMELAAKNGWESPSWNNFMPAEPESAVKMLSCTPNEYFRLVGHLQKRAVVVLPAFGFAQAPFVDGSQVEEHDDDDDDEAGQANEDDDATDSAHEEEEDGDGQEAEGDDDAAEDDGGGQ
jgi:hypothetical protein